MNQNSSKVHKAHKIIYLSLSHFENLQNFLISFSHKNWRRIFLSKGDCKLFPSQRTFTCSKSTIETIEKGVKYVQS